MDIKNTAITAKVVIESLIRLLENENVDISSIKFKVGSASEGYESPDMEFGKLIDLALKGLEEAKAQAVPEWISVNDQMPPIDETVLVCWDHAQDIEPEKEYVTTDENLDEYWPNCQDEPPTHWMPLPKVIEAQEQSHE